MLLMKQTKAILSTYTADVSGVCSALFELGGMTVMHDASGCNSTYNTHDEPRWYNQDSLVFISALTEMEAILGQDDKLIEDLVDAAGQLHPRFVAIAGTPIPMMTGCDIPAIAAQVEARTGLPSFGFQTNGMHSYVLGAGEALAAYAGRFPKEGLPKQPRSVNILGATPLDFSVNGAIETLKELLVKAGWRIVGCWAMGSTAEELDQAGSAEVNLVISSVGLKAAQTLRQRFGTPYVMGAPFGSAFFQKTLEALERAAENDLCLNAFDFFTPPEAAEWVVIGESVTARSLAASLSLEHGIAPRVICPVETFPGILSAGDLVLEDEEDIMAALQGKKHVVADPLFEPVLPKGSVLHRLPHEAYSGRMFRKEISNLMGSLAPQV